MVQIKIVELKEIAKKALKQYGYDKAETAVILDILFYAQLRGNNQGLVKLIGKGLPKNLEAGAVIIEKNTKLSAVINGNKNPGMVIMKKAMEMALEKAKEYGFSIVGTNNTSSSTGAIGYYAHEIAKQGFIGFVYAGSPETVATHGSYDPLFGTNPLAIGIPTTQDPIVLDMATAAMAYFGLVEAKTAGKSIPDDVAYDENGNVTTDPAKAMDGAIRSFDRGYKGAGLSMVVEILTGPLIGATFVGIGDSANWGNLIYVIDPELLTDKKQFEINVSQLIQKVKNANKLPGVKEIYYPGERGDKLAKKRIISGEIAIEENLLSELKKVVGE